MKYLILSVFCLGVYTFSTAQINFAADSALLAKYCCRDIDIHKNKDQKPGIKHNVLLKIPLAIYKETFSAQISANCEYYPTCSSFSWALLDEFNVFKALLLTADRLTRCNGNSQPETFPYLIRSEDAKIVDYPAQYRFTK